MHLNTHKAIRLLDFANKTYETIDVFESQETSLHSLLESFLPSTTYYPTKGDKIWFLPGCDVPRFKLKEFLNKYDCSVVKYREKANVVFVSADSFKPYVERTPGSQVYLKSSMLRHLTYNTNYTQTEEGRKVIAAIQECPSEGVYASFHIERSDMLKYRDIHCFKIKDEASKLVLDSLFNECNIYHQDELLCLINAGKILDKDDYHSITRLLDSNDKNDHKVAMETLANSDYVQSAVYLLSLLVKYKNKIKNCDTHRHVNFKALLKFFKITALENFDELNLVESLIATKLLDQHNLDLVMPMINERISYDTSVADYFDIGSIKLKSELQENLRNHILKRNFNTTVVEDQTEELCLKM